MCGPAGWTGPCRSGSSDEPEMFINLVFSIWALVLDPNIFLLHATDMTQALLTELEPGCNGCTGTIMDSGAR